MYVLELDETADTVYAHIFDWTPVENGDLPELEIVAEGAEQEVREWFETNWSHCTHYIAQSGLPEEPEGSFTVWQSAMMLLS